LEAKDTDVDVSEVKKRVFRLIKNSLALGFILFFFSLLRSELVSLVNFVVGALAISGDLVINVISLIFVVYFGYFILVDIKYFLDWASNRFEKKDQGSFKGISYDVAGLISLVLASFIVTPLFASVEGGQIIVSVFNIVLLAIGFFIVYHLANQIYMLAKAEVEKIVARTKRLRASHHVKKIEEHAE
jgi:hypothetical protein